MARKKALLELLRRQCSPSFPKPDATAEPAADSALPNERVNRVRNSYVVVGNSTFLVPVGSLVGIAVIVVGAALWLWSLVDALRTNGQTWNAAGQNKLVWVVVIILLTLLGSVLYVAVAKRALKKVSIPLASAEVSDSPGGAAA
jgi:Phospholipase_D-nuclease N-terminal